MTRGNQISSSLIRIDSRPSMAVRAYTVRGAGPVGILTAQCALSRGASKVVLIDNLPYRLKAAQGALGIDKLSVIGEPEC